MQQHLYLFLFFLGSLTACTSTTENGTEISNAPRPKVAINTSYGEIVIELFNETPQHRDNFLKLAKEGFYDSLLFHRIQPNFMIQGGDPDSRGTVESNQMLGMGGPNYRIPAEINSNFVMRQGALCGFHRGVKHHPDKSSNGSQFMIIHGQPLKAYQVREMSIDNQMTYTPEQIQLYETYGGSPQLDGKYTIFGQIVQGTDVLDKIVHAKTYRSEDPTLPDRPLEDIRMTVKVIE